MNFSTEFQILQPWIQKRQFKKAKKWLSSYLNKNPQSADAYYWIGFISYLAGDIQSAKTALQQALKINAYHTNASLCLCVLLKDIGHYQAAQQHFEKAHSSIHTPTRNRSLEINQKFVLKHLELGDLYLKYLRYHEAIEEYMKAQRLSPSNKEIRFRLARTYEKKGWITRAIQELQQLKKEYPKDLLTRFQLGLLYFHQEKLIEAQLEWDSLLAQDPHHQEAKYYVNKLQSFLKDKKTSFSSFTQL